MNLRKLWNYVPAAMIVASAMIIIVFVVADKAAAPMTMGEAQAICNGAAYPGDNGRFHCYGGKLASRR